ncbi:MAG: DUF3124 domain-containing protein [Blastocatellia bacterium]
MRKIIVLMLSLLALTACASRQAERQDASQPAPARTESNVSPEKDWEKDRNQIVGQTIYVPIYSHIYIRDKSRVINLAATLSIRNTDAQNPIRITSARYYGTDGAQVREYVNEPLRLAPMASTDFVVAEDDTSGGSGANFIVEWSAGAVVTEPVVEAVMISTASQLGISFVSAGRVIQSRAHRSAGK